MSANLGQSVSVPMLEVERGSVAKSNRGLGRTSLHRELLWWLTAVLSIDRAVPLEQVRQRAEFARFAPLLDQPLEEIRKLLAYTKLRTLELPVTYTVGSRHAVDTAFICATARVTQYKDSTVRQLAGLAALRYGLGFKQHDWKMTALYRSDEAIPDARIGFFHNGAAGVTRIAVEWDSGSAVTTVLREKIKAYAQIADLQLWAVASRQRAETITQCLSESLPIGSYLVFIIDWRDGLLVDVAPSGAIGICEQLAKRVPGHAPWFGKY